MNRGRTVVLALLGLTMALAGRSSADLAAYLARPEPAYRWEQRGEKQVAGGTVYDLHLVSQVWQGITWEHRLQVFRPDKPDHPDFCALLNTGGNGSASEEALGMSVARSFGGVFAILYNIPKQPLFGGKVEDALVVYTWQKYLETGDESWPLHFPMAKAVLKAMDAIQAFSKRSLPTPVDRFLITGASKRGWTTWLAGASRDPRIKAIAPMVIDTLNVAAQVPHQLAAYGKPSEQIGDYTSAGMLDLLDTPKGKRLMALEDPYSYRDILTLPKMIILGTNDRYWAQDALNLYWDGLKGPKWVLYTPNSGHGLQDMARVLATLSAFARSVAAGQAWPRMRWAYSTDGAATRLRVSSDIAGKSARLFRAHSATQDFRDSKWTSEPMQAADGGFTGTIEPPADGYTAVFGEVTYDLGGRPFNLSTQLRILGTAK